MRYPQQGMIQSAGLIFSLCLLLAGQGLWVNQVQAEPHSSSVYLHKQESSSAEIQPQRLAIIIDDMGNAMAGTDEILNMPVKLTVAVMPFMRSTEQDAKRAHEKGHDVIVHLPMEPKQGNPTWLGPGAILSKMTDEEVRRKVEEAVDNVPYAIGINNHMGSKITEDERIMGVILEVCRERGLFFVDSKTNYWSVVSKLCDKKGLPNLQNHIFLDDVHTTRHVTGQLRKVQEHLDRQGKCVTIGHVGAKGDITASAIKQAIPGFQSRGVQFIGISELVREQRSPGVGPGAGTGFTLP